MGIKARVITSIFMISLINGLQHSLSPVLSSVRDQYPEVGVSMIQMLVTVPTLVACAMAILTGWLALYISKKKIFLFAALTAGVSIMLPLASDSFTLLFASRALYGIAMGIVVSLVTALVADFFDGDERVQVMGVQGASVGVGLMVVTTLAGILGKTDYHNTFFLGILGFLSFVALLILLPDKPVASGAPGEKRRIRLTPQVFWMAGFIFAEGFFIIIFTTNLSMHLSGALEGNTAIAGGITGVFSVAQIVMGILLGRISSLFRKYTLPIAMFAMAVGYLLLMLFPGNLPMLLIAAVFCGFSQSVYCAKAMAEVTTVVDPQSTPMAASLMTCALCISQFISPVAINGASKALLGSTTTEGAFLLGSIGACLSAIAVLIWKRRTE